MRGWLGGCGATHKVDRAAILILTVATPLKRLNNFRLKPVLRRKSSEYRLQAEVMRGLQPPVLSAGPPKCERGVST